MSDFPPPMIEEIDLSDDAVFEVPKAVKKPRGTHKRPAWLVRAMGSSLLADFRNDYKTLGGFELLQRLSEVVAMRYHLDPTKAGVLLSSLSQDPSTPRFYGSIQRFNQGNARGKFIVCSHQASSMEEVLRTLSAIWLENVRSEGEDGTSIVGSPFAGLSEDSLSDIPAEPFNALTDKQGRRFVKKLRDAESQKAQQQNLAGLLKQSIDEILKRKADK